MNALDIVLALVIVGATWGGWRRGFLVAGTDLIALLASIAFAFMAYPHIVAISAKRGWNGGVWSAPLGFLAAYVLMHLVLTLVFAALTRRLPPAAHTHVLNRTFGILPGAINGLIGATIVSMLLLSLPLADELTKSVEESMLANRFAAPAEKVEARLRPIFDPAINRTLSRLTVTPESRQSIKLPFTVKAPKDRADLEAAMLDLVNAERQKAGLPPLKADPQATEVARVHSRDMFARGYFSHITPEGKNPFDRMRAGGLKFRVAGENLAYARTLPMAHQGLMESPGHRANILRSTFGRVGIGIVDGGRYGLMVTQNFRN